eukprot:m.19904 g.19904  ORF g.19904 m.19904 type:complete len:116 (+) comp3788_c0_seq1:481-828(+)
MLTKCMYEKGAEHHYYANSMGKFKHLIPKSADDFEQVFKCPPPAGAMQDGQVDLTKATVGMDWFVDHIVKPLTAQHQCALVTVMSRKPTRSCRTHGKIPSQARWTSFLPPLAAVR